jgi:hypothetical protein
MQEAVTICEVMVKLPPVLKHYALKMYGEVEV